jgi:hypothetical protein
MCTPELAVCADLWCVEEDKILFQSEWLAISFELDDYVPPLS